MSSNSGSPLVPERPLVVSVELAKQLGLEEAALVTILADAVQFLIPQQRLGSPWYLLEEPLVAKLMPFWQPVDVQRLLANLKAKGVLALASAPYNQSRQINFSFHARAAAHEVSVRGEYVPKPAATHNFIAPGWQPDNDTLSRIHQLNIPEDFALSQVGEFVLYWRERNEPARAWGSKFLKHVLARWREQEAKQAIKQRQKPIHFDWRPSQEVIHALVNSAGIEAKKIEELIPKFVHYWLMHGGAPENWNLEFHSYAMRNTARSQLPIFKGWRPSEDTLEVMVQAGISREFIEDAIPEFELYWREQKAESDNWNRKFRDHVQRQWLSYQSALEHDTVPRRIPSNWQPSEDVYDVLRLANIDVSYAQELLPEFVIYWRDSNQVYHSWNTRFLQYVKKRWASAEKLETAQRSTREISLVDELTDRSWAQ
ncbi:MAG TPA: DnaT-like ssDNA-binding domain-containing protein [Cellvibrionaceae bacterium]|nr:DnaT-like ssDNA-binding domain-containing protein [Cellvibrionaceae bacterium]HMW71442.1 DnaT-like ssDNA-binding domain-containing protein [Cellvibrionaceae bacterium]